MTFDKYIPNMLIQRAAVVYASDKNICDCRYHWDTNCFSTQVWCVESEEQQFQNWTVDSGQHNLDITTLKPGKQYWITIAAVNGAGVGMLSDPHGFVISKQKDTFVFGQCTDKMQYVSSVCDLTTLKKKSCHDFISDFISFLFASQTRR